MEDKDGIQRALICSVASTCKINLQALSRQRNIVRLLVVLEFRQLMHVKQIHTLQKPSGPSHIHIHSHYVAIICIAISRQPAWSIERNDSASATMLIR